MVPHWSRGGGQLLLHLRCHDGLQVSCHASPTVKIAFVPFEYPRHARPPAVINPTAARAVDERGRCRFQLAGQICSGPDGWLKAGAAIRRTVDCVVNAGFVELLSEYRVLDFAQ